jgi:SRR1
MYSDFTTVKSRKKRKNKSPQAPPPLSDLLAAVREQISHSEWFAQCSRPCPIETPPFSTLVLTNPMCVEILEDAWKDFSAVDAPTPTRGLKVLCLGLGSPSSSQIARIQLAFLAETCKRLEVVCFHFYRTSIFCGCRDNEFVIHRLTTWCLCMILYSLGKIWTSSRSSR